MRNELCQAHRKEAGELSFTFHSSIKVQRMNLQIKLPPLAPGIEKPLCGCMRRGHIGSGKRAPDAITAHLKLKMELFSCFFPASGGVESPQSEGLILALAAR